MISPFSSEYARELVADDLSDSFMPILKWIEEFEFGYLLDDTPAKKVGDMRKILKSNTELSDEEIEDVINDKILDTELAYQAWASACLIDAMVNDTDYSADCIGYVDEYSRIISKMRAEAAQRKLFRRRPAFNVDSLIRSAADILEFVLYDCQKDSRTDSELAQEMRKQGRYEDFHDSICDLQRRLRAKVSG